jgi:hypothetical protein
LATLALTRRATVNDQRRAADEVALRYREPLVHAAFNLQTRLYNIGCQDFLEKFVVQGTPDDVEYARYNSAFLFGQYLCWAEILRREAQYLDPVDRHRDRAIMDALEDVRATLADSLCLTDRTLRVFRGNQRAIGEVLLVQAADAEHHAGPRWDCMGYAAFTTALREGAEIARWFAPLLEGVDSIAREPAQHLTRLTLLQNRLVDLIALLDPAGARVPADLRRRLALKDLEPAQRVG